MPIDVETFSAAVLAAPHPLAAAAGRDVLVEGGNAIEAAIAAAAAAAVVVPDRAGLGADAVWLLREPGPRGRVRALDARGAVGIAARPAFFRDRGLDRVPARGPLAALSAPGAAAGWAEAQALSAASGGRLPMARLLAPALALARDGWELSASDADRLADQATGEDVPTAGARHRRPLLAATLDHLSAAGLADLYRGDVAREAAADLDALGAPLGRDDLRAAEARWREPRLVALGRSSVAAPPTRAGTLAVLALALFDALGTVGFDRAAADGIGRWHGLIEALRAADDLLDAAEARAADPAAAFDPARLARVARGLDPARARPAAPPAAALLAEAASLVAVVDREGAAAVAVHSLGAAWGSGVVSGRTGILLGNRGAAFAVEPGEGPLLRPGRRAPIRSVPLLASAPREGRVAAVAAAGPDGAAGAAQLAERLLRGMAIGEAAAAGRFALGATPDGREAAVRVDGGREPGPLRPLDAAGHAVVEADGPPWAAALALRDGAGRLGAAADDGGVAGL